MTDTQVIEPQPGQSVMATPVNPFKSHVLQGLLVMAVLWLAKQPWMANVSPLYHIGSGDAKNIVEYICGSIGGALVLWGRLKTNRPIGFGDSKTITPVPATKG